MSRTVVIRVFAAAVVWLAMTAPPLWASLQVRHGAFDICATVDGGLYSVEHGMDVCCASEAGLDDAPAGPSYCVICNPAGSDNCEMWYTSKAPGDRGVVILLSASLVAQQGLYHDMSKVLSTLNSLQTQMNKGLCPAPTK